MENWNKILGLTDIEKIQNPIAKIAQSNPILGIGTQMNNLSKIFAANDAFSIHNKAFKGLESVLKIKDFTSSFNGSLGFLNNPALEAIRKQDDLMKVLLGWKGTFNYAEADAMKRQSNIMNIALGGNTLTNIVKAIHSPHKEPTIFKALSAIDGIRNTVTTHLNTYNHQLQLSEQLAKTFSAFIPQNSPMFNAFTSVNFVESNRLTAFDVFSGTSFLNTLVKYNQNEKRINQIYDQAQAVLTSNMVLQEEVKKLNATIIAMQEGDYHVVEGEQWYKIKDIKDYAEWFMNKILIRKLGINPNVAIIIIVVIVFTLIPLIREIYIEAKGSKIYDSVMDSEEEPKIDTVTIIKYIQQPKEITDFTIDKTPIYMRDCNKTKRLGYIDVNTTLSIIKIKNGWCFVEGLANVTKTNNKKNRKKYGIKTSPIVIREIVRGWVEKKHLDMFQ